MNAAPNDTKTLKLRSAARLRQTMTAYFQRLKTAAEDPEKKVAWCTSVGPVELLYAFGFEVYFPENHAAMIAAARRADQYIPVAGARGYSPDACAYLTSDIGAFIKNETPLAKFGLASVPKPDVLVFNTNQCDVVRSWLDFYARHFDAPLIGISTPLVVNEVSAGIVQFVAQQYRELLPTLETVAGRKFDLDRFKETLGLSREACALWGKVLGTAKNRPAAITFFDASVHMGPIVIMRGTPPALTYYEALLEELRQRVRDNHGAIAKESFRLYWEGMPIWGKLRSLADFLAGLEASTVASTYCNSWAFDDFDPEEPFESSARAYTKLFIVRADEPKEEALARLLADFEIDGIIYHDAKTCPRNSNNRHGLQARLQARTGVPCTEIQGDMSDLRCFSEEQSKVILETFVNQLAMRK